MIENKIKVAPKYVYRVDKRPPAVVFRDGFLPIGANQNLISHVLGHSLNRHIPLEKRSFFISTSDNIDAAIRHLGVFSSVPLDEDATYYIYKIRANQLVYSVLKTINYLLGRIKKRNINFEFGDYVLGNEIVETYFERFAYQSEWVNVGEIPSDRIKSAYKINIHELHTNHITDARGNVKYFPEIDSKEILNMAYNQEDTKANLLPYDIDQSNQEKAALLTLTDSIFYTDVGGGVLSSLGFSINLDIQRNNYLLWREKHKIEQSPFGHCHIDLALINKPLKNKYDLGEYKYSEPKYTLIYLYNEVEEQSSLLTWTQVLNNKYFANLTDKLDRASSFIYDNYQRICLSSSSNGVAYCLTSVDTDVTGRYEIDFKIATTNDIKQKFFFQVYRNDNEKLLVRVVSKAYKNYSLYTKKNDELQKIYLLDNTKEHIGYQEIFIDISKDRTSQNILLQQRASTQLIDTKMSWTYARQFYIPNPETGFSKSSIPVEKKFFYNLDNFKITYVNESNETFYLCNKRYPHSSPKWDWIRWTRSEVYDGNINRERWYLEIDPNSLNKDNPNYKIIRSFENNDWLKVMLFGANWGSFFTTNIQTDDSISTFHFSDDALI